MVKGSYSSYSLSSIWGNKLVSKIKDSNVHQKYMTGPRYGEQGREYWEQQS